jgi:hypothetical protein
VVDDGEVNGGRGSGWGGWNRWRACRCTGEARACNWSCSGDNVEWRGLEESQRGEGSELVCLEAEGEAPFYRCEEVSWGSGQAHGGDGVWSDEGAREGARGLAGIMASGASVLAQQKEDETALAMSTSARVPAEIDDHGDGDRASASQWGCLGAN